MNNKKETITINNFRGNILGIKVLLANNTLTNQVFAIIVDVNPAGHCYLENVATGDILLSVNGTEINNLESFNYVVKSVKEVKHSIIQITITKKGVLDGSDLIKRCIDSPCTELCEMWNDTDYKIKNPSEISDKRTAHIDAPLYQLKCAKALSVDELRSQKLSTESLQDLVNIGKITASNTPKFTYQKALPMVRNKKKLQKTVFHLPAKSPTSDLIPSPQPHFIQRPNARSYQTTKQSSSLKPNSSFYNPTQISHSSESSDTSSLSSPSPSPTPEQTVRKISSPADENVTKPKPMPRKKPNFLSHQRSIEPREFFSLKSSIDADKEWRSQNVTVKPKPNQSNELINDLKHELRNIRDQDQYNMRSGDPYPSLASHRPTNGETDV